MTKNPLKKPGRRPGDIVYLKSGSVPMVVEAVFDNDACQVRWMRKKYDRSATFCGTSLSDKQPKF
jgi:uncharacterized protein YodC (DUF2158 family)